MRRAALVSILSALIVVLALVAPASADVATIDDIAIKFREPCNGPTQNINLGDMIISNTYTPPRMEARLTIDQQAKDSGLFDCPGLKLHYYQLISIDDSDPKAMVGGVEGELPITDPPKGGWDYMYEDGAERTMPDPDYGDFIDDDPWYYSPAGETANFNVGSQYNMVDAPNLPNGEILSFRTYLVGEVTENDCDGADCLKPKEMALLAHFQWYFNTSLRKAFITDANTTMEQFDLDVVTRSLTNGGFTGWTPIKDAVICCGMPIPEPATFILACCALCVIAALSLNRRQPSRAGCAGRACFFTAGIAGPTNC